MSYISKPIFSDDNKGDPKYMWKDPLRMDKWLLQPSSNHKHVHLHDENDNIIDRITPKRGRALFFNGDILHASSLPVKSDYRAVINIDMEILNA